MTDGASVALRPATDADRPFLAALYATTRDDLAALPVPPEQRVALVDQQFAARSRQHAAEHPDASSDVVVLDGVPVGRLVVSRAPDEVRIVDVALLPRQRGRGLGSRVLAPVLAEADARGVVTTLHVEVASAAQRLYARLGFRCVADDGAYRRLVRPPAAVGVQAKTA